MTQVMDLPPATQPVVGLEPQDAHLAMAVVSGCKNRVMDCISQGGRVCVARLSISGPLTEDGWVKLSLSGTWPLQVACESVTLVQWASYFGLAEVLEVLLRNGGSATATSELDPQLGDLAPFLLASMGGRGSCLRLLAHYNADVNVTTPGGGYSALHLAALYVGPQIIGTLIDLNIEVDTINASFKSALFSFVEYGDDAAIPLLAAAGANLNTPVPILRANHGVLAHWYSSRIEILTPFAEAVANDDLPSMKSLILLGADTEMSGTTWMQSADYDDQGLCDVVNNELLPWVEKELDQRPFFAFLMSMAREYDCMVLGLGPCTLVAGFIGLRIGVERGHLHRACDAIRSGRVRARSPWPWCDGAYYIQYREQLDPVRRNMLAT